MAEVHTPPVAVPAELLEAVKSFPRHREVGHCGTAFRAEPFAVYATCPGCGRRVKERSFSAVPEVEDVFDAVFAWMAAGGEEAACRRIDEIREDLEE